LIWEGRGKRESDIASSKKREKKGKRYYSLPTIMRKKGYRHIA